MNIIERAKAPTSKFFRTLRNVGLALAAAGAAGAALLASPVALPAAIVTVGGYLTLGGAILSAVSQITVEGENSSENTQNDGKSS